MNTGTITVINKESLLSSCAPVHGARRECLPWHWLHDGPRHEWCFHGHGCWSSSSRRASMRPPGALRNHEEVLPRELGDVDARRTWGERPVVGHGFLLLENIQDQGNESIHCNATMLCKPAKGFLFIGTTAQEGMRRMMYRRF